MLSNYTTSTYIAYSFRSARVGADLNTLFLICLYILLFFAFFLQAFMV